MSVPFRVQVSEARRHNPKYAADFANHSHTYLMKEEIEYVSRLIHETTGVVNDGCLVRVGVWHAPVSVLETLLS